MIKNYFRIAYRNLMRHKAFAAINITGLAIGIAAALLLFTVVRYEMSFDRFQKNYNRIYHVVTEDKHAAGSDFTPGIPMPALDALRLDFPQQVFSGIYSSFGSQVSVLSQNGTTTDKKFIEESGVFYIDPEFFRIFNYHWLSGTPSVLQEPYTTVLTQKMAAKYYGDWKKAMGQTLKLDNAITVKVSGILEDVPQNTDFPLGVVTSMETFRQNPGPFASIKDWGHTTSNFQVFTLVPEHTTAATINAQLQQFCKKHYTNRKRAERSHFVQPLSDVHFDGRFENFGDHVTSRATLWTLTLIGVFIIIMACINFINLSTAQAAGRSKEIGIRKVLGSNRVQLFGQVMGETALVVLAAIVLAIALATFCLPYIKHIASIEESLDFLNTPTLLFLCVLFIMVTLLAGLYPSFVLSGFNPANALKNKITSATVGGISLRKGLVVVQFAISQILIVGTLIAVSQMNYVRNADLGFNKEAVFIMNVNTDSAVVSRQPSYKQRLLNVPGAEAVTFSSDVPSSDNNWSTNFAFDHKPDEPYGLFLKFADEDYFKTFGLQFLAGGPFSKSDTTREVVVNETLMSKLGVKDPHAMIGKEINMGQGPWKTIVGVVRDFKTNSLHEDIKPTLIGEASKFYSVTAVKLKSQNLHKTQAAIEAAWNEFYPEYAVTSSYMDENITEFYKQEEQLSLLYKIFASIAVFISCLGLYGLVSFMAVQRTKEIGVRKVLGASVSNIIYLFSKEFTWLVLIGFLISIPAAYYLMNSWLENFVYRIQISLGVFVIAVIGSLAIAWITVGYKSIKAALANPVKSLRSE